MQFGGQDPLQSRGEEAADGLAVLLCQISYFVITAVETGAYRAGG